MNLFVLKTWLQTKFAKDARTTGFSPLSFVAGMGMTEAIFPSNHSFA